MKSQKGAVFYAWCAVLLWSTVASAFKIALRYLDFLQLLFYSSFVSVLILFAIILFQRKQPLFKEYSLREYSYSAFLGLLNPFLYYLVLFKAYSLLPAQVAQPLNYTWPITLVLLSIFFLKQKILLRSILAILISFSGVLVISMEGNPWKFQYANSPGVLLAIGSAFLWSLFWIFNLKDNRDEVVKLFLNFSFGFLFILMINIFSKKFTIPSYQGLLGAAYVGLFEMGIPFVLWLKSLKSSKTTAQVSQWIYFSPFLSLVFIHFILEERIHPSTILGLVLIVSGTFIQEFEKRFELFRNSSKIMLK